MGKVSFNISMSLDGYINGPGVTPEQGLGRGGEFLHEWAFNGNEKNRKLLEDSLQGVGAIISGRRTYDLSVPYWGGDGPSGDLRIPVFVLTHAPPADVPEGSVYTFVTGGIEDALEQAEATAGDKNVVVGGGALTFRRTWRRASWTCSASTSFPCCSGAARRCSRRETRPGSTSSR